MMRYIEQDFTNVDLFIYFDFKVIELFIYCILNLD